MFEKLFDLDNIKSVLDTIATAANQQTAAKKQVGQAAVETSRDIMDSAAGYGAAADDTLRVYAKTKAQQEEAARLAESDNIFDRISLIGAQTLDPRAYTREGRTNQRAEASQSLALRGQVHNVETQVAQSRLAHVQAQAALSTVDTDAKMDALRMQIEGLQLSNQAIAQTELMRQNNLILQDRQTLEQTLIGPKEANGQVIVNGMPYSELEIQEQAKKLQTREMIAVMSPQASDPDYRAKLNAQQSLMLQDMSIPELEQLRANDYMMPDGSRVLSETFDHYWNRSNIMQQEKIQMKINEQLLPNQVRTMLTEGQQMSEQVRRQVTPGSPLSMAQTQYTNTLAAAAELVTNAPPEAQIAANTQAAALISTAQEGFIKAVDREARVKANNDTDLATIYRDQMLGIPVAPQRIEDLLGERYASGKGFGEVLPLEMSTRIAQNADIELQALRQQEVQSNFSGMGTKRSEKELKREAIQKVFDKERRNIGITAMNNIQTLATQRKDSPAAQAGLIPSQIQQIHDRAAFIAQESVAKRYSLSPDQLAAMRANDPESAGLEKATAAGYADEMNMEATMQEYQLFESEQAGLGYNMQQWYMKTLPEMAKGYADRYLSGIEQTFAGDSIAQEAQQFSARYTMVDEQSTQMGKIITTEVATKAKQPEAMWPMLVQMSDRLAESEKASIYYDIIHPIITQAKSQGFDAEQTTGAIFDALSKFKSEDSVLNSSVTTLLRDLPSQVDRFENMWNWALQLHTLPGQSMLGVETNAQRAATSNQMKKTIPWLKDTPTNQPIQSPAGETGRFNLARDPRDLLFGR